MASASRLAQRLQQGDKRAFEEFVDEFGARLQSLARRYSSTQSDAEDLTQEIFIQVFRSVHSFRGEAALSTWVYRVALNLCIRHSHRAKPEHLDMSTTTEIADESRRANPERCAAQSELSRQVRGALDTLSEQHREVILLHELHGLTYQECAGVLDVPVGTVKSRLSNAFKRLRGSLGGYVLGDDFRAEVAGERVG